MARITLRIDDRDADELRALARSQGRTVHDLLRAMVDVPLDPAVEAIREPWIHECFVRAGIVPAPEGTTATDR